MSVFQIPQPDGTQGTATIEITYKERKKKITITIYGCIVKNDANLQEVIGGHIRQSADIEKLKNTIKYFFYTCDPDFEEEMTVIKAVVTCYRFSKPSQPKSCQLNPSPDNFIRVQEHIFVPCDSQEFNKSDFLKDHSKKIRLAQELGTTAEIYGLSCQDEKSPIFIPLKLNHQSSNVYGIDKKYHENYQKLEDVGPVLLQDEKTPPLIVVGSFERKENNEISISIFGKNPEEGAESQKPDPELDKKVDKNKEEDLTVNPMQSSHSEEGAESQTPDPELDNKVEKNKEEEKVNPQSFSHPEEEAESQKPDPELDKKVDKNKEEEKVHPQSSSHPEEGAENQTPDPELDKKVEKNEKEEKVNPQSSSHQEEGAENQTSDLVEDKKVEEDKISPQLPFENNGSLQSEDKNQILPKPGKLQEHDDTDSAKDGPQNIPPKEIYQPSDSYDGFVHEQPTTMKTGYTLASEDQIKPKDEKKDILTVQLKQDQSSEEKLPSPIQETSKSFEEFDPLDEIRSNLKDGSNQMNDDLGQKKNTQKYRRFLLYVAQNATGKCQEIGENLGIEKNKLQNLKADYNSEGNAEQIYQMLVCWTRSDRNPILEKLLDALIKTELVEVAKEVCALLKDRRNRGGRKVEDKLLNQITNEVKDNWKFLGRYLGIDDNAIHAIKMDNRDNTREQARQMLDKWKQSKGSRATTDILINALEDVGKSNVVKTVRVWDRQNQLF